VSAPPAGYGTPKGEDIIASKAKGGDSYSAGSAPVPVTSSGSAKGETSSYAAKKDDQIITESDWAPSVGYSAYTDASLSVQANKAQERFEQLSQEVSEAKVSTKVTVSASS